MCESRILLSIITVNLNNEKGLLKTIQSVLPQLSDQIEYLIFDGSSQQDNSIQLIESIASHLAFWSTAKDEGVYDAMNKGIQASKGKFLLFLNSGDVLLDNNTLKSIVPLLKENHEIISCPILIETDMGAYQRVPIDVYSLEKLLLEGLPHQSTFIKRSLFDEFGSYSPALNIAGDWELWLRFTSRPIRYKRTDLILSKMEKEGIGAILTNRHVQERVKILKQYASKLGFNLIMFRLIYRNRKFIIRYIQHKLFHK